MSGRHLENVLTRTVYLMIHLENVLRTSSKRLEDILKMSWGHFWKTIVDVLKMFWKGLFKTSWKRLENVLWRRRRKMSPSRRVFPWTHPSKQALFFQVQGLQVLEWSLEYHSQRHRWRAIRALAMPLHKPTHFCGRLLFFRSGTFFRGCLIYLLLHLADFFNLQFGLWFFLDLILPKERPQCVHIFTGMFWWKVIFQYNILKKG